MDKAKDTIKNTIKMYTELFPEEYQDFLDGMVDKRKAQTKFGEVKGSEVLQRALYEVPETLHNLFYNKLEPEEYKWFVTKEGGTWFTKAFKQFRLIKNI